MNSFSVLTIDCPHCGQINSITTNNLPLGSLLSCSQCKQEVAQWHGGEKGFVPFRPAEAGRQEHVLADTLAPT